MGGLYRSLGQEACSVGSAYALERGDIFTPLIRNLGAIFVRGARPREVFAQYMAKPRGPTRGRDLNLHFGWLSEDGSMPSVISMLGDMIPILTGAVIAERMKRQDHGCAQLDRRRRHVHRRLPRGPQLRLRAEGAAGADRREQQVGLLDAHAPSRPPTRASWTARRPTAASASRWTATTCWPCTRPRGGRSRGARRGEGPTLIEADTMRMRGHAEHDDMKYVPARDAGGLGRARPARCATSAACWRPASPRAASWTRSAAELDAFVQGELAWAEASPLPDPRAASTACTRDRPVRPPLPPLVAEWERRAKDRG